MTKGVIQAMFKRSSGTSEMTGLGNIIPFGEISFDLNEEIIISYFNNVNEWLAVGASSLIFKNEFHNYNQIRILFTDIESVRPFSFNADINFTLLKSRDVIFIKTKDLQFYSIKVEEGKAKNAFIQILNSLI